MRALSCPTGGIAHAHKPSSQISASFELPVGHKIVACFAFAMSIIDAQVIQLLHERFRKRRCNVCVHVPRPWSHVHDPECCDAVPSGCHLAAQCGSLGHAALPRLRFPTAIVHLALCSLSVRQSSVASMSTCTCSMSSGVKHSDFSCWSFVRAERSVSQMMHI